MGADVFSESSLLEDDLTANKITTNIIITNIAITAPIINFFFQRDISSSFFRLFSWSSFKLVIISSILLIFLINDKNELNNY